MLGGKRVKSEIVGEFLGSFLNIIGVFGVGAILLTLMGLTVVDVFSRFVLLKPIYGASEYAEFLMVMGGFLGISWCAYTGRHIQVEILVSRFPMRIQSFFDALNYIMASVVAIIIIRSLMIKAVSVQRLGVQGAQTGITIYPFYYYIAACYVLLAAVLFLKIVEKLRRGLEK
ncbi:MAG: TRAP transporter small permease [Candidatus Bathyarchaeia archaeon]